MLISCVVTAQLICAFVFKYRFFHVAAQLSTIMVGLVCNLYVQSALASLMRLCSADSECCKSIVDLFYRFEIKYILL